MTTKVVQKKGAASKRKVAKGAVLAKTEPAARVSFEATPSTFTCYSNLVEVGALQHEFTILVGRVPTKPTREIRATFEAGKELVLEPDVQILVAPTMVPGIIKALQSQLEKYEQRFGSVGKKGARDD
jgi:hypothetical protein